MQIQKVLVPLCTDRGVLTCTHCVTRSQLTINEEPALLCNMQAIDKRHSVTDIMVSRALKERLFSFLPLQILANYLQCNGGFQLLDLIITKLKSHMTC